MEKQTLFALVPIAEVMPNDDGTYTASKTFMDGVLLTNQVRVAKVIVNNRPYLLARGLAPTMEVI